MLMFPGPSDQTYCSILNVLQLVHDLQVKVMLSVPDQPLSVVELLYTLVDAETQGSTIALVSS